jgi:hypothetical protein
MAHDDFEDGRIDFEMEHDLNVMNGYFGDYFEGRLEVTVTLRRRKYRRTRHYTCETSSVIKTHMGIDSPGNLMRDPWVVDAVHVDYDI